MEIEMDMGKNILIMVMFNLKVNIQMEKEMERGKNIILIMKN